jgi:hypothetical protein
MLKAIERLYAKYENRNVDLLIKQLNMSNVTPYPKEVYVNATVLTKLAQMKRQIESIPTLPY